MSHGAIMGPPVHAPHGPLKLVPHREGAGMYVVYRVQGPGGREACPLGAQLYNPQTRVRSYPVFGYRCLACTLGTRSLVFWV